MVRVSRAVKEAEKLRRKINRLNIKASKIQEHLRELAEKKRKHAVSKAKFEAIGNMHGAERENKNIWHIGRLEGSYHRSLEKINAKISTLRTKLE